MVSQSASLAVTLRALDLKPEHEALKAYCQGLAAQLDENPEHAALWREYRPALEILLKAGEPQSDDGENEFLRVVAGLPSTVGHTP